MHILLTNDDGIFAPGIRALGEALTAAGHRVTVSAPDRERSAASHSVALGKPLQAAETKLDWAERAWAVSGTPSDCASIGLFLTRDDPPDAVLAGINRGMNMGGACVYSGTVASALEASMCGAQAMAVSLCVEDWGVETDFGPAARVALRVLDWMRAHPLPLGVIYSLNVPQLPFEAIRGIAAAKLAPVFLDEPYYESAPEGGWLYRGRGRDFDPTGTDVGLCRQGFATMTKLTWDFRLNADDSELNEIEL